MARLALTATFFIESDLDPEEVASDFQQGLSALGGPVLEAAQGFPGGDVTGAEVRDIREATADEISSYFEE